MGVVEHPRVMSTIPKAKKREAKAIERDVAIDVAETSQEAKIARRVRPWNVASQKMANPTIFKISRNIMTMMLKNNGMLQRCTARNHRPRPPRKKISLPLKRMIPR